MENSPSSNDAMAASLDINAGPKSADLPFLVDSSLDPDHPRQEFANQTQTSSPSSTSPQIPDTPGSVASELAALFPGGLPLALTKAGQGERPRRKYRPRKFKLTWFDYVPDKDDRGNGRYCLLVPPSSTFPAPDWTVAPRS
eukprot:m51a1_g195 hypothetical protein (141) ;mRNA; f:632067-632556